MTKEKEAVFLGKCFAPFKCFDFTSSSCFGWFFHVYQNCNIYIHLVTRMSTEVICKFSVGLWCFQTPMILLAFEVPVNSCRLDCLYNDSTSHLVDIYKVRNPISQFKLAPEECIATLNITLFYQESFVLHMFHFLCSPFFDILSSFCFVWFFFPHVYSHLCGWFSFWRVDCVGHWGGKG